MTPLSTHRMFIQRCNGILIGIFYHVCVLLFLFSRDRNLELCDFSSEILCHFKEIRLSHGLWESQLCGRQFRVLVPLMSFLKQKLWFKALEIVGCLLSTSTVAGFNRNK